MEIELPDGTVLDAPDGADPSIVAKGYMRSKGLLAEQPEQGEVRAMDRVSAAAGGVNSGIAGLLGLPVDTVQHIIDLGKALSGSAYHGVTGKPIPEALEIDGRENLVGSGDWIRKKLDIGMTRPDDKASRYLYAAGSGLGGAIAGPATGAAAIPSAVGGVVGATASQFAAESGASPILQVGAGMIAGSAASSARPLAAGATKRVFRGGEDGRVKTAENIQAFEDAGATPTAGQATGNRRLQATESLLSKAPGSGGVMTRKAEDQAAEIGAGIEKQASVLAPKSSAEQAGRGIEKGITGEGGFKEAFKAKQKDLYRSLDEQITPDSRIPVSNTRKALASLNEEIAGAPELSRFFKNGKLADIEAALKGDTTVHGTPDRSVEVHNPMGPAIGQRTRSTVKVEGRPGHQYGALPYEAVKKLRTLVGDEISDFSLTSSVPRSKWTALYTALSKDMEAAAREAGPKATAAWTRANNYTRAGMRRMEVLDGVVDKNGGPEAVFKAATSGTKEGATTLRAVMQSVPKDQQRMITATVLRRLGRAKPGAQDDLGEAFSTETFLTNWNTMAPEAKGVLFNRYGPEFRQDMDQVARVAANLRDGSKVMRNPSGSATAGANLLTAGTAAGAVLSGNVATAGAIAGTALTANLSARLLTHPPFVKWLAKTTKAPKEALPALIAQLARSGDPVLEEAAAALQNGKEQPSN
jgi:hypothetical protein